MGALDPKNRRNLALRVGSAIVLFPIAVALTGHDLWEDLVVAALAVLILVRHTANIRRLINREENTLDARKP